MTEWRPVECEYQTTNSFECTVRGQRFSLQILENSEFFPLAQENREFCSWCKIEIFRDFSSDIKGQKVYFQSNRTGSFFPRDIKGRGVFSYILGSRAFFPVESFSCWYFWRGSHKGTSQNGTSKNGTLHNGTLQNDTLQNGTLPYGTASQNGTWYETVRYTRYSYITVNVTKRYSITKRYVTEKGNSNLTLSTVRQTQQNSTNHIQGLVRSG